MVKKICVIINNRANYGRVKSLLQAIKKHKRLKLQLILESSSILARFGSVNEVIKKDGFRADEIIYTVIEGENPIGGELIRFDLNNATKSNNNSNQRERLGKEL